MKRKARRSFLNLFVLAAFMFSLCTGFMGPWPQAEAAAEPFLITGTGLEHDVEIAEAGWSDYDLVERYYSSINTLDFHKITKVRGCDLWDLIGEGNLKTDQDYSITFISGDGFKTVKTVNELKSLYYYPDSTEENQEPVQPMLGFYRAELISVLGADLTPPLAWDDRELTEDDADSKAPRLFFGQQNMEDMNQSKWAQQVVEILVGEERPAGQPVLTISGSGVSADKEFTLTELKNVPDQYKIDETYQYNSKGGLKEAAVKGVDLWYVLDELVGIKDSAAPVEFIASDGYEMDPQTQTDLADPQLKYVLAYEVDGAAVSDDSGNAQLRIYRKQKTDDEFGTVFKAIVGVNVGSVESDIDFTNSLYKHITYAGAPYNVDSITSATLTIEGPGVKNYRAISLRQLEEENDGLFRGTYAEAVAGTEKQNSYEGITISYLLDEFVDVKDNAGKIILKDKSRQKIAEYTLDEIRKTDYRNNTTGADNLKMIVAYGINEVPLVYLNSDTGYVADKMNDNGCFKLAVGQKTAEDAAVEFDNVAYIYVTEADAPGIYEHTQAPYNDPRYTNYMITLTGSGLGKEVNYTVADIEAAAMDDIRQEAEYSLSNSEYFWYYNTYKGVSLWDLLLKAGLNPEIDEGTKVQFVAADNYNFPPLTIKDIKDSSLYGYYEKDPTDLGDGNFDGSQVEPLKTGYPPLVAYGYNGYPYVNRPSDPGYNSGLGNDGGPLRIIFGKKNYNDNNGSNQVQFFKKIIIGEDADYTTHSYAPFDSYAASPLAIKVLGDGGTVIKEENLTVTDIENMVYSVPAAEADKAMVKDYYFTKVSSENKISDLFEGVGLWYLLSEKIGLPGTTGTVTFKNESVATVAVSLEDLKKTYFNEVNGAASVKPVLAYAKRGFPLVKEKTDAGYLDKNNGGPLMILFGQTEAETPGLSLENVQEITVNVQQDQWAHLVEPYATYGTDELKISGNGAKKLVTTTVREIETLQDYIFKADYCLLNNQGTTNLSTFKGIDLYQYLNKEIGFKAGAAGVKIIASDGWSKTFTLEELAKTDYINQESSAGDLKVMLAYGCNEKPLVPEDSSGGYDADAKNSGGPLWFIIGQTQAGDVNNSKCIKNVAEIEIEGATTESWKHDSGLYVQYLDQPVLRVMGSQVAAPRTFTLREIEALDAQIVRDSYTGDGNHELEGVNLWQLINEVVGLQAGVTDPSIRVFSGQSYNQVLKNLEQVKSGVVNSQGLTKDIILAYAQDGYPLVPDVSSPGYDNNNAYGPLRLIIEENKSMWVKNTDCIVVGTGDYEKPEITNEPEEPAPGEVDFTLYRNDDGSGLPLASIRAITPDGDGGLWVGTYGAGAAYKNCQGDWTVYNTDNSGLPDDTIYAIAFDTDGKIWFSSGGAETPQGVVCKDGDTWTVYNTTNSSLPGDFVFIIAPDENGGLWFGTGNGAAYRAQDGAWTVFDKADGLPATSVNVITPDSQGGVWFGCYPDTLDEQAGTYAGGYAYRDAAGNWTSYSDESNTDFGDNWIRSISIDGSGGVWVARSGNYAGGGKVDYISAAGQKQTYDDLELYPAMPAGDTIRLVAADQEGGLWLGTKSSGLLYRNETGELFIYNSDNGWPSAQWNSVYFLEADGTGAVWAGTNGGVACIEGANNNTPAGKYTVMPKLDAAYTNGLTVEGINTMSVNSGISGLKYFTANINPVVVHAGSEMAVFVQFRDGMQINLNATEADFDLVNSATAGFNVQAGDVVKVFIVDELNNAADFNPTILE